MKQSSSLAALLLLSSLCGAQAAVPAKQSKPTQPAAKKESQAPATSAPTPPPAPAVGPEDTVITIPGVCAAGTSPENCATKMTRSEFERMITAMNPTMPAEARRGVANGYAQLLAMASAAQKAGVDRDPNVQIQLHIQSLSLLAQALQRKVIENSKPTLEEIESYHAENSSKYEELALRRIVVLKSNNPEVTPEQLKTIAQQIHDRATAGEDPDKLEVEAFKLAKSAGTPPNTSLGWKRRGGMDPRHEPQILALHAGEVSPVMEDGQAYYIYKVDSKRLVPIANVQKEIEDALQSEHAQKTLRQIIDNSKPQLNEAYFGPAEQTKAPPQQSTPPK